jgi:hypothetical protein
MEIWYRGFSLLDFKADGPPIQFCFGEICSWIAVVKGLLSVN